MKGILMKKATLQVDEAAKRRLAFAGMVTAHIGVLPDDVIAKFSQNGFRGEIPDRLLYGFTVEESKNQVTAAQPQVSSPSLFKAEETNLASAIAEAEHFNNKVLGVKVDIRKMFDLPTELPWKNVLVIYDPGLNNRQAVEKALQGQKLTVYEESNVMEYSGSQANSRPTLRIIENSLRPTADTLGSLAKSPDQLNADGRNYLDLRGYALAFSLRYFISKDKLDPETWTWFTKNRLPGGRVARGDWHPALLYREVRFSWSSAGRVTAYGGARLAIDVPLKP